MPDVALLTAIRVDDVVRDASRRRAIGWWSTFGFVLVLFLLVQRFAQSLTHPVDTFREGIEALGRRELSFRLPDLGEDEMGRLAQSFNRMMRERQDLDLAAQMQERLLPTRLPRIKGYELGFRWNSLSQLAGDYCDVLLHPDGSLVLLVVDVAGHGLGAGLISMMMKAVAERAVRQGRPLVEIIQALHHLIHTTTKKAFLATMVAAQVLPDRHLLRWCKAGHPSPYLRRGVGRLEKLAMKSFPLGIRKSATYQVREEHLDPQDTFLMFTDGLLEAVNPRGEPFGLDRLEGFLKRHARSETLLDALLKLYVTHRGSAPAEDDVTLLLIGRRD